MENNVNFATSLPQVALVLDDKDALLAYVARVSTSKGRVQALESVADSSELFFNGSAVFSSVAAGSIVYALAFTPAAGWEDSPDDGVFVFESQKSNSLTLYSEDKPAPKNATSAPKTTGSPLGAAPLGALAAEPPQERTFTNLNASGPGSLWATVLASNDGDVITPATELWSSGRSITVPYPHPFPLGTSNHARVSIKSGRPGYKVVLDFNNADVSSLVSTSIAGQAFEDVVFKNYAGSGGSYAQVQFANNASGTASFTRCGFIGWASSSLIMFRHSSVSNTAKCSFYNCVFAKSTNSGAGNGWAVSGYCSDVLSACTFDNSGTSGYPVSNTAQFTTLEFNVSNVSSAATTTATLGRGGFAIIASSEPIDDGPSTGVDYFGEPNDGTIGAVSGGLYTSYKAASQGQLLGSFIGVFSSVAESTHISHAFTFKRLDRDIYGAPIATLNPAATALFYIGAKPTDVPGRLYEAHATTAEVSSNNVDDGYMYTITPAYMTHFYVDRQYVVDAAVSGLVWEAKTTDIIASSGLDSVTYSVGPSLYLIAEKSEIRSLAASDWSFNGFDGSSVRNITSVSNARGFVFNFKNDAAVYFPDGSSNYNLNTYKQYSGAKVQVFVGSEDKTEELKAAGKIVDFIATDYIAYVFGEQDAALATLALDTPVLEKDLRVQFFGVKDEK